MVDASARVGSLAGSSIGGLLLLDLVYRNWGPFNLIITGNSNSGLLLQASCINIKCFQSSFFLVTGPFIESL